MQKTEEELHFMVQKDSCLYNKLGTTFHKMKRKVFRKQ